MSNKKQGYNNKIKIFKYLVTILSILFLFIAVSCSGNNIMYSLTLDGNGATDMANYKEIYYNTSDGGWYSDVTGHNQIFNIDIPRKIYRTRFDKNDNDAQLVNDSGSVTWKFGGYAEYIDEEGFINENIELNKNVTVSATWKQLEDGDKINLADYIPTNTKPDKEFIGWGRSIKSDSVIENAYVDYPYTPKSSNETLYAKWEDSSVYKLTLNQNEGTSGVGEFTTELYYAVTARNGSHWFDREPSDGSAVAISKIDIPKREYAISFNTNPENLPALNSVQKPSNLTFKWDFQGYGSYIDSTGLIKTGASISEPTEVSATWTRQSRDFGLDNLEAPGFRFQGWYEDGDNTKSLVNNPYPGSDNGIRKDIRADVTLNAKWENLVNRNTLTLNNNGATGVSGSGTSNTSYIYYNTNYNPTSGQDTSPWMDINDNELFSIPTPKKEYTVTYKKDNLNVDVEWAMPSGETPPADDKDTFTYNFLGYWDRIETIEKGTLNENYIGRGTHYNEIDSSTNSVVYDGSGNAKLNIDTTTSASSRIDKNTEAIAVWGIDSNKKIKLPVCSAKGYNFVGWRIGDTIISVTDRTDVSGNPISSEFNAYYPKNSNVTLVAVWEPKTYTITLDGSTFTGLSSSLPYDAVYYTVGGTWTEDENKQKKLSSYITPLKKEITVRFEAGTLENSTEAVPSVNIQSLTSSYAFKGFDYKPIGEVDDPAKELGVQIIDEKGNIKSTFTEKNSTTKYEIYYDGVATAIFSDTPSSIDLPTPKIAGYRLIGYKVVPVASDATEKTIYVVGDAKDDKFIPENGYIRTVTNTVSGESTVSSTVTLRGIWEKIKYHVEIENDDTEGYVGASEEKPILGTDRIKLNNGDGLSVKIKVVPYVYKRNNNSEPTADIEKYNGDKGAFITSITDDTLTNWFENFAGDTGKEFIPDTDGLKIAKRDTDYIVVRLKGMLRSTINVPRNVKLNINAGDIANNRLTEDEFKDNVPSLYFKNASSVVNTIVDKDLDNKDVTTVYSGTRYYPLAVKTGSLIGGTNGVLVKINIKNSDGSDSKVQPRPVFRENLTAIDVKNWFAPFNELVGTGLEYAIIGKVGRKSEIVIRITGKPSISRIGTVAISIPYTDLQGGYSASEGTVDVLPALTVFYNTTDYFNKVFDVTVTAAEQNSTGYNWSDVHVAQKTIDQTMSFVALKGGIEWPVTWTKSTTPNKSAVIKEDFAVADIAVTGGFANVIIEWAKNNGYNFGGAPPVRYGYKNASPSGSRGSSVDPVTNFTWVTGVIFSNAATEWYNAVKGGNLTCAYTSDGTLTGTVLRDATDTVTLQKINPNQNSVKTGTMSHVPGATGFRLPTRAEWQYLASVSPYPLTNAETKFNVYTGSVNLPSGFYAQSYAGASGDPTSTITSISDTLFDYAIYSNNATRTNSDYGTQAVGKYWTSRGYNDDSIRPRGAKPNLIGLYDVFGNTFEFLEDIIEGTLQNRYVVGAGYLNNNILSSYYIGSYYECPSINSTIDGGYNGGLRLVKTI